MPYAARAFFKTVPAARRIESLSAIQFKGSEAAEFLSNLVKYTRVHLRKVGEAEISELFRQIIEERKDDALDIG